MLNQMKRKIIIFCCLKAKINEISVFSFIRCWWPRPTNTLFNVDLNHLRSEWLSIIQFNHHSLCFLLPFIAKQSQKSCIQHTTYICTHLDACMHWYYQFLILIYSSIITIRVIINNLWCHTFHRLIRKQYIVCDAN